jgi:hypothetical protein
MFRKREKPAGNAPPQQRFAAAPLDAYAERITYGVAYVGGLLMLPLLFAYLSNLRWGGLLVPVAFAVALLVYLLLSYAFQPVAYILEPERLLVRRRWMRTLRVPLSQVTAASFAPVLADVPRRGLRFAFNPGVFGYMGPFHLDPYGEAFFQATSRERLIALARQGAVPLIISPARPRDFLSALNEQRGQAAVEQMERAA